MLLFWLLSLVRKDAGVADIAWGLVFVSIAWAAWLAGERGDAMLLAAALTTIWGLRLAIHIGRRNLNEAEEDRRYAKMRQRRPDSFWIWSLVMVFLLQGMLALIVSLPLTSLGASTDDAIGAVSWVGVGVFLVGLAFEAIGDAQLTAFKRDPSSGGQVMDRGLWKYTRHPNYFGDATLWWGLGLVAVGSGAMIWTLVGPALMSFLLIRVSGVKMLESDISSRRPGYREYIEKTSAFFPRPPHE